MKKRMLVKTISNPNDWYEVVFNSPQQYNKFYKECTDIENYNKLQIFNTTDERTIHLKGKNILMVSHYIEDLEIPPDTPVIPLMLLFETFQVIIPIIGPRRASSMVQKITGYMKKEISDKHAISFNQDVSLEAYVRLVEELKEVQLLKPMGYKEYLKFIGVSMEIPIND